MTMQMGLGWYLMINQRFFWKLSLKPNFFLSFEKLLQRNNSKHTFGPKHIRQLAHPYFEVLQSLENICRCQPIAYATGNGLLPLGARGHVGPHPCDPGHIMPRELLERSHMASHVALRASQREKLKHDHMVGEWTNLHATRVWSECTCEEFSGSWFHVSRDCSLFCFKVGPGINDIVTVGDEIFLPTLQGLVPRFILTSVTIRAERSNHRLKDKDRQELN